jgi:hypothetical protein
MSFTFKELIDFVAEIIQDPSFTDEDIGKYLNRGVGRVCSGILLPGTHAISPPLPDLFTTDTIETVPDAGVANLPDDYDRGLTMVLDDDSNVIPIARSMRVFMQKYPVLQNGNIHNCVAVGKRLMYRDVPTTAKTLTVHYYKKPSKMEEDDDIPDGLPEALHYNLLVPFASKEIFNLIEDGISGPKVNTEKWTDLFHAAVNELGVFVEGDGEAYNWDREAYNVTGEDSIT